jgi:hypothetical protein
MRRLLRLWCRLVGHRPVLVPLGWCPNVMPGVCCMVFATCCDRCRRELTKLRRCGTVGGPECPVMWR